MGVVPCSHTRETRLRVELRLESLSARHLACQPLAHACLTTCHPPAPRRRFTYTDPSQYGSSPTRCLQLLGELEEALATTQQALDSLQQPQQAQQHDEGHEQPAAGPQLPTGQAAASAVHAPAAAAAAMPIGPQLPPSLGGQPAGSRAAGPQMHPRNKYAAELPDFEALAELHPSLQPFLQVCFILELLLYTGFWDNLYWSSYVMHCRRKPVSLYPQ